MSLSAVLMDLESGRYNSIEDFQDDVSSCIRSIKDGHESPAPRRSHGHGSGLFRSSMRRSVSPVETAPRNFEESTTLTSDASVSPPRRSRSPPRRTALSVSAATRSSSVGSSSQKRGKSPTVARAPVPRLRTEDEIEDMSKRIQRQLKEEYAARERHHRKEVDDLRRELRSALKELKASNADLESHKSAMLDVEEKFDRERRGFQTQLRSALKSPTRMKGVIEDLRHSLATEESARVDAETSFRRQKSAYVELKDKYSQLATSSKSAVQRLTDELQSNTTHAETIESEFEADRQRYRNQLQQTRVALDNTVGECSRLKKALHDERLWRAGLEEKLTHLMDEFGKIRFDYDVAVHKVTMKMSDDHPLSASRGLKGFSRSRVQAMDRELRERLCAARQLVIASRNHLENLQKMTTKRSLLVKSAFSPAAKLPLTPRRSRSASPSPLRTSRTAASPFRPASSRTPRLRRRSLSASMISDPGLLPPRKTPPRSGRSQSPGRRLLGSSVAVKTAERVSRKPRDAVVGVSPKHSGGRSPHRTSSRISRTGTPELRRLDLESDVSSSSDESSKVEDDEEAERLLHSVDVLLAHRRLASKNKNPSSMRKSLLRSSEMLDRRSKSTASTTTAKRNILSALTHADVDESTVKGGKNGTKHRKKKKGGKKASRSSSALRRRQSASSTMSSFLERQEVMEKKRQKNLKTLRKSFTSPFQPEICTQSRRLMGH